MSRAHLLLLAVLLLSFEFVGTRQLLSEDDAIGAPSPNVPELKQLERFAGTWEAALPNSDQRVVSTRKWIMNGTFLFHEFELSSGDVQGRIYRGYNKSNDRYTLTMIDSTGNVSLLTGYWDNELKTMTYDAIDSSCFVQRYESYFADDQTELWTITLQNGSQLGATAKKQANP